MLHHSLLLLTLSAFLSSGGLHGVVVKKTFKPLPLSHSLGVDGIYRLELRDQENKVHRQMVSREIFALYDVGDDFDDRVTPAEVRSRKQAARARLKEATALAEAIEARIRAARSASDERTAQLFLRQDMLPETEGF